LLRNLALDLFQTVFGSFILNQIMAAAQQQNQVSRRLYLNHVIVSYFKQRLASKGYDWSSEEVVELPDNDVKVVDALISLSNKMVSEFGPSITAMTEQAVAQEIVTYDGFVTIASEVFHIGIQWSHIVTLMVFASELAFIRGVRQGDVSYINFVSEWLTRYLSGNEAINSWLESHGGWHGVVYYDNPNAEAEPPSRSPPLVAMVASTITTLFGYFFTRI